MNYVVLTCFLLLPCLFSQAQTSGAVDADKPEMDPQSCTDCVSPLHEEKNGALSTVPNSEPSDAPSSTSLATQDTFEWSLTEPTKQADTAPKPAPIWDKRMWAATMFLTGAAIFDIEMTHQGVAHHKCIEGNLSLANHPSRFELYFDNFQDLAPKVLLNSLAVLGMRAAHLPRRYWKPVGYAGPLYAGAIHLRGGIQWYARCW
jgi:hypothetical protein